MPQGTSDRRHASGSPLRGALLALLVNEGEPLSGYRLATLVERRLGPAWRVTRQSVYGALERLVEDGLVSSAAKVTFQGVAEGQRVYSATDRASAALEAWMESPATREPMRVELQARIALSRAHDAPHLLRALDAYERDCFEMLRRSSETEVPMGSWVGLAMNLTRVAVDESLQADLRWIALARRWIEEFLAERSAQQGR
jgi:DNA-binding PadR family transcriptional regulator